MAEEDYQRGMKVRRQVMGDVFVDRAMDSITEFTRPVQDYINENCWGSVWARDTLPLKTRSIITIATLAALKSPTELKGHVRGALRNGCTPEEIREVLLHTAPYIGAPALQEAFRAAKEVIEDL
ncbi:carboxymuconolactone decarboxylase family protein [Porticoccus litoralis]|jgi:4-carboxymuconolactone decarboxylase|uniref:Carboxymuconolactone decarboxylase family protein n=1 Tax=Porticoccus litoralis TaxID=434086 RepID=A0AAW8B2K5_9GAMM|nr:carboxymuconolactone decarboxylase family protein [Porticoccus litoralis]MDP1519770.1 carboxymuconolactone decarboxylase family protein [Porticoccus litoralis]TNF01419.1 MAG: 4-carboxymuconolactone decarboxylase [Gammaproteobacteria bacterium]